MTPFWAQKWGLICALAQWFWVHSRSVLIIKNLSGARAQTYWTALTKALTIGKRRRHAADFPGSKFILQHIKDKPSRKRVGIVSRGPPAREGTPILHEGQEVGRITSGCPSPSLGVNVAMGYVPAGLSKKGTPLTLKVRQKMVEGTVTKMPFVPTNYYSPTK